jgi:hypothetical protein
MISPVGRRGRRKIPSSPRGSIRTSIVSEFSLMGTPSIGALVGITFKAEPIARLGREPIRPFTRGESFYHKNSQGVAACLRDLTQPYWWFSGLEANVEV